MSLDDHAIDMPCPGCGENIPTTIGRLKSKPDLVCSVCGAESRIDLSKFEEGRALAEKALGDLLSKPGFKL